MATVLSSVPAGIWWSKSAWSAGSAGSKRMPAARARGRVSTARRAATVVPSDTTSTRSPDWVSALTGESSTTASPSSAAMASGICPTPPVNCESW